MSGSLLAVLRYKCGQAVYLRHCEVDVTGLAKVQNDCHEQYRVLIGIGSVNKILCRYSKLMRGQSIANQGVEAQHTLLGVRLSIIRSTCRQETCHHAAKPRTYMR